MRWSRGHSDRLVVYVALATAAPSMWLSNVAAAALVIAAVQAVTAGDTSPIGSLERPLSLAIALAADVGGIAAAVGSKSNGIAMVALASTRPVSFVQ
ncbi:MAG: hypothetical protein H7287_08565 [Thermoleophilia bacterium]|nr:hypothetical protein [Thermoleophilia bacterium]